MVTGGDGRRRRSTAAARRWRTVEAEGIGDFRRRRIDSTRVDDEDCGGAYGLIRAPIAARSAVTASSQREEHDDGLSCTRLSTVKKLLRNY